MVFAACFRSPCIVFQRVVPSFLRNPESICLLNEFSGESRKALCGIYNKGPVESRRMKVLERFFSVSYVRLQVQPVSWVECDRLTSSSHYDFRDRELSTWRRYRIRREFPKLVLKSGEGAWSPGFTEYAGDDFPGGGVSKVLQEKINRILVDSTQRGVPTTLSRSPFEGSPMSLCIFSGISCKIEPSIDLPAGGHCWQKVL